MTAIKPAGLLTALVICLAPWLTTVSYAADEVRIGSKNFTESVILGEMLCHLVDHAGSKPVHLHELGGTQILWKSLLEGEIDAYVEYSGTLKQEILKGQDAYSLEQIAENVAASGVSMSQPLGFNNTYALGMRETRAEELGISKISDLRNHPDLDLGFSEEFVDRGDGWYGLKAKYRLPQESIRGLDHSLAYRGVWKGSIDVIDLYSTDPEIISFKLRVLEDDQAFFPMYEAVIVYRSELASTHPKVVEAFQSLAGKIDNTAMMRLNKASRIDRKPEQLISAQFLKANVDSTIVIKQRERSAFSLAAGRLLQNTIEHLVLVVISLTAAIVIAVPLGVVAYRNKKLEEWILGVVGIIQTIPSMAMLVFMIPFLGLGAQPAILALFFYSLLPIVRGTHTGLASLSSSIHESALALGLPSGARLRLIELPLASKSILSGIKTAAVINVGTATIGALIGAGGYGQPIITGIRLADFWLILQGAIPAALLALAVQLAFTLLERFLVPAGLRVKA
ncbi:MAG: glycine betaine ABC transporter substrate-binding protein [Aureliella sp.]